MQSSGCTSITKISGGDYGVEPQQLDNAELNGGINKRRLGGILDESSSSGGGNQRMDDFMDTRGDQGTTASIARTKPSREEGTGEMSKFEAQIWDRSTDQNGRPCWVNKNSGQACYALLDKAGLPLDFPGGPFAAANPAPPMAPMTPMVATPMYVPPAVGPVCPPAGAAPIAIVGDTVKEDKWTEYEDKDGNKYYHNPSKPDETTWDKPEDYDKQQNAGKPAPPKSPKKKKNNNKYK
eukprot:g15286.t1